MTVPSTTTVEEVMKLITDKRFRHLPVVDGGRLVGMVSIGDILRRMVDTHRHEAEQLNNTSPADIRPRERVGLRPPRSLIQNGCAILEETAVGGPGSWTHSTLPSRAHAIDVGSPLDGGPVFPMNSGPVDELIRIDSTGCRAGAVSTGSRPRACRGACRRAELIGKTVRRQAATYINRRSQAHHPRKRIVSRMSRPGPGIAEPGRRLPLGGMAAAGGDR